MSTGPQVAAPMSPVSMALKELEQAAEGLGSRINSLEVLLNSVLSENSPSHGAVESKQQTPSCSVTVTLRALLRDINASNKALDQIQSRIQL